MNVRFLKEKIHNHWFKPRFNKFQLDVIVIATAIAGFALGSYLAVAEVIIPRIFASETPWTQTDWSGGTSASSVTGIVTTFSSSSDIVTSTAGQLTLSTGSEQFSNQGINSEAALDDWLGVDPRDVESANLHFYAEAGSSVYSDAGSTAATDGQDVEQWNDLSGNNHHVSQSSSARKPTYYDDQINGRPALSFIQSSDTANNDDVLYADLDEISSIDDLTVLTVSSFDYTNQPSSNYDYIYSLYNPSDTSKVTSISRYAAGGNANKYYNYYAGAAYIGPVITSGFQMFTQQISNVSPRHYLWFDRSSQSVATINSQYTFTSPRLALGKWANGTWALNGRIAEFILYGAVLDSSELHDVENYLANKYNLTNTLTYDTSTKYSGDGSAKLISSASDTAELLQEVNVGNTDTYTLKVYAYTDGSAVSSSDVELYYNGSTVSTTYTSVGSGWYELLGSVTGANEDRYYGAQVKANKTVYIDDFSLTSLASSGTLTSNTFDAEFAADWGTLSYNSSGSGTVIVKARTDSSSDMSGATAWGSCSAISSGSDVTANSCVTDTDQYLQYQVTLQPDSGSSPVFEDISIAFAASDQVAPTTNASSLAMKTAAAGTTVTSGGWSNASQPYFSWTSGADNVGGGGLRGYCMYLGTTEDSDPSTTSGLLQNSPVSTSGTTCGFVASGTSIDLTDGSYLSSALTTGQTYYLYLKAVDTAGNLFAGTSAEFEFRHDETAPTNVGYISAPSTVYGSVDDMTFNWPSSGGNAASDDDSGVLGWQYSLDGGSNWKGTTTHGTFSFDYIPDDSSTYSYDLTEGDDGGDISVGTNTVYLRTVDVAGNFSSSSTYRTAPLEYGGAAPTFAQSCSIVDGVTVTPSTSTSNSFALSWNAATATGDNTVESYYYMINQSPPSTHSTLTSNSTQYVPSSTTSVTAGALTGAVKGSNTVYVVAVDDDDNYSPSNCLKGTFTLNSSLPDAPQNLTAADSSIKSEEIWKASLTWNEPAYTGTGSLTYVVERSTDNSSWSSVGTTTGLSYSDDTPSSTTYYYRVGSYDTTDASESSPSYTSSVSILPKGTYDDAPDLSSGPTVSDITTKRATISWSTSRTADSKVQYGTSSGSYFEEEPSKSDQVTSHEIKLTNLSPGTKYYYKVKWTDEDGNTGTSSEKTFTTDPAPDVKDVSVSSIGLTSATVNFTVTGASSVNILYGESTSFGGMLTTNTSTNETTYSVALTGLKDGTKYYFKINALDVEDDEYEGTTLDFETLPAPRISNVRVQQVKNTAQPTAYVTWSTNTDVSSIVTYHPVGNPAAARDEVNVTRVSGEHSMIIRGLSANTPYTLIVKGRDVLGNEAQSDPQTITTATDTRPPAISDLKIEGSVSSTADETATAQFTVSWTTDEPSTSQVEFGEGTGSVYTQRSQEDSNLTFNHLVVISGLTPSRAYHLRALSKDSVGNESQSVDTVAVTPKASKSALNLVINNLSQVFGFLSEIE